MADFKFQSITTANPTATTSRAARTIPGSSALTTATLPVTNLPTCNKQL